MRDINAEREDKKNIAAYSIDAGFHVFLFCMNEHTQFIYQRLYENTVIKNNLETVIRTSIDPKGIEIAF